MDWYWFGIELIYCTSTSESILVMLDNLCVELDDTGGSSVLVNFEKLEL